MSKLEREHIEKEKWFKKQREYEREHGLSDKEARRLDREAVRYEKREERAEMRRERRLERQANKEF